MYILSASTYGANMLKTNQARNRRCLARILFNTIEKLLVVLFKTWIFLSETFCFFCKVVRNRYCNITTHRASFLQIEVYAFRQWPPLPQSKRF